MLSPIRVGGCQDNGGAGIGVAGDPGAVDGEEDHEHHEEQDDNGTNVAVGKVAGLVGGVDCGGRGTLGALLGLQNDTNNILCSYSQWLVYSELRLLK